LRDATLVGFYYSPDIAVADLSDYIGAITTEKMAW
jgi:hypothetical protein